MSTLNNIILITGCARSGTSLCAGVINLCGAFGGKLSGKNINNQKGMFENSKIRNEIIKPYLETLGVDRLGQYPLPNIDNLTIDTNFRNKIKTIMVEQGYNNQKVFYKGAKLCLIWPTLNFNFPNAKWIIVRRKTSDIINSCINTGFMRAFQKKEKQKAVGANNEHEGWLWWVNQHLKRFKEMEDAGLNIKYVWPEKMIVNRSYAEIKEVIDWLGLTWNNEVFNFVAPELWNKR